MRGDANRRWIAWLPPGLPLYTGADASAVQDSRRPVADTLDVVDIVLCLWAQLVRLRLR